MSYSIHNGSLLPIVPTEWGLRVSTAGTTVCDLDSSKSKGFVVLSPLTFGIPPEFPGF